MTELKDIVYAPENGEKGLVDFYLPDTETFPLYMFIHGGGLTGGSRRRSSEMTEYLTSRGVALASVEYRLYPDAKFPDYIRDCTKAADFILHKSAVKDRISSFTVGGSSAGGYISQMLYFCPDFLAEAGVGRKEICGYFFDAGQPTTHFNVLKYDRGLDPRCVLIDEAAPLFYLREPFGEPGNEPVIFITASSHDMVNRREQNEMLKTAMLHFGFSKDRLFYKIYDCESHCGYVKSEEYFEDICRFVKLSAEKRG